MQSNEDIVNGILVDLFNKVLFSEEKTLKSKLGNELSLKDIHIIEAIDRCSGDATTGNVGKCLNITLGTLTTAIDKLVEKGYVLRKKDNQDRRKIYLKLTEKGNHVNHVHSLFHKKMAESVINELTINEQNVLVTALNKIRDIFDIN